MMKWIVATHTDPVWEEEDKKTGLMSIKDVEKKLAELEKQHRRARDERSKNK